MADHEIELDTGPAAAVDLLGGAQQILGGDGFVDDVAQAIGGGLGRKGEAAAPPAFLEVPHQLDREGLDAQAGQADAELFVAVFGHNRLNQLADVAVVAGTEA